MDIRELVIGLTAAVIAAGAAFGWGGWESRVPNGHVFGCNTCHMESKFYVDMVANGNVWNENLAVKDSDGDGYSNGIELQDPYGVWRPGKPNPSRPAWDTYNPDNSASVPPYAAVEPVSWGRVKAMFR
jgi:hypothetical protein